MNKKIVIAVAGLSLFVLVGCTKGTPTSNTSNLDDFAKCITTAGAKIYGTETCPHCQNQKALFDESFQYLNFTDCMKNPNACEGIDKVPTWEFADGVKEVGEKTFEQLAEKTNCELAK